MLVNRGDSLIWPKRVCAAEQGIVFRVLSLRQSLFGVLNRVCFLTGRLQKSVKKISSLISSPILVLRITQFYMQNEANQVHKIRSLVLNTVI